MSIPRNVFTAAAATAFALTSIAACGDDDDGGSGSAQDQVADMTIEQLGVDEGVDVDADCVRDKAHELSDDDAQVVIDAGLSGEADVSADGQAVAASLVECLTVDTDG